MTLVGANNCQPILHITKILAHCYSTDETINQFAFGYMINPSLKKEFRKKLKMLKFYILFQNYGNYKRFP